MASPTAQLAPVPVSEAVPVAVASGMIPGSASAEERSTKCAEKKRDEEYHASSCSSSGGAIEDLDRYESDTEACNSSALVIAAHSSRKDSAGQLLPLQKTSKSRWNDQLERRSEHDKQTRKRRRQEKSASTLPRQAFESASAKALPSAAALLAGGAAHISVLSCFREAELLPQVPAQASSSTASSRVRHTAHIPGRWSAHVHIPIRCNESLVALSAESMAAVRQTLPLQLPASIAASQSETSTVATAWYCIPLNELHLSLSRPLRVPETSTESFTSGLRSAITGSGIEPFYIQLCGWRLYTNDERDTTFVGLDVVPASEATASGEGRNSGVQPFTIALPVSLRKLIDKIDVVLRSFDLPSYYEQPSPHVTIASCRGIAALQQLQQSQANRRAAGDSTLSAHSDRMSAREKTHFSVSFFIQSVSCSVGDARLRLRLPSGAA